MTGVATMPLRTARERPVAVGWTRWGRWAVVPLIAMVLVMANSGFWRSGSGSGIVDHGEVTAHVDLAPGVVVEPADPGVHPVISAAAVVSGSADQSRAPGEHGPADTYFGVLHVDGGADLGTDGVWVVVRHHVLVDPGAADRSYAESLEAFDPVSGAPVASTMWALP